jgi:hypothetical protein
MPKPLLCVTLAMFLLAYDAEQSHAQDPTAQEPTFPAIAAFNASQLKSTENTVILVVVDNPFTDFALITPDGRRKVGFSLEKDSDGTKMTWTIIFTLYEKQADAPTFGNPAISLNVVVADSLSANAQIVAQNGLTASQAAHATGPSADAATALANGTGSLLAAASSIQNSLK